MFIWKKAIVFDLDETLRKLDFNLDYNKIVNVRLRPKINELLAKHRKDNNMSQIIEIIVENKKYQIEWALSEYFGELKGKKFMLNKMAADQIVMINNLSETAKILLSAVAGAVIQHLIDNNCHINSIFENGYFIIKNN